MKVIEKRDATASLGEYAEKMRDQPIVVTSKGKPIAALLPVRGANLETVSLSLNPKFLDIIERSRARQRAGGTISADEMRRRFGLAKSGSGAPSPQYWILGAARRGSDDHYREFIKNGYWELFWRDEEQPAQATKRDQMRVGDRIAIKKMLGGPNGKGRVRIRAIGIIKSLDPKSKRVSVRWEKTDLKREVRGHSLYKSIQGPFDSEMPVVKDVFLRGSKS